MPQDPATGKTNQVLLAKAIRNIIPRILRCVVQEVVSNKASIDPERFQQGLRVYLLVHQVWSSCSCVAAHHQSSLTHIHGCGYINACLGCHQAGVALQRDVPIHLPPGAAVRAEPVPPLNDQGVAEPGGTPHCLLYDCV